MRAHHQAPMSVASDDKCLGLVLSGGGARGAYEAGVLGWIARHRPELFESIAVITGSSVGAVNGAFIASHGISVEGALALEQLWSELSLGRIYSASPLDLFRRVIARRRTFFGTPDQPARGIFETTALERLIKERIDWPRLSRVIASGRLKGLAMAATEIGTGHTHVFVQHHPDHATPSWPDERRLEGYDVEICPQHVLASTAIPFLFSPVQVGDYWYTDGSLRQNTPLSPALRLGADRLLVISLGTEEIDRPIAGRFPGMGQLLGKIFNGIFLDRTRWDLDRLSRINQILDEGVALYGDTFVSRIQDGLAEKQIRPHRPVRYVNITPGRDIGVIAGEVLAQPGRLRSQLKGILRLFLTTGSMRSADAASYILVDGAFARRLIDLGKSDAARYADALDDLLAT